jgi:hypothetical protein
MSTVVTYDLGTQLATFFARNPTPKRTVPYLLTFISQFPILPEERGRSNRSAQEVSMQPSTESALSTPPVSATPATPQETSLTTLHAPDAQRTAICVVHPRPLVLKPSKQPIAEHIVEDSQSVAGTVAGMPATDLISQSIRVKYNHFGAGNCTQLRVYRICVYCIIY